MRDLSIGRRLSIICGVVLLYAVWPLWLDAASPCVGGHSARKYHCKEITLQSRVSLRRFPGKPESASSLWGYADPNDQREYAIIGLSNGTAVVDVTNAQKPKVVGHIPGVESLWREVKVYSVRNPSTRKWDAYAYVSTEGFDGGLQIIDLSELPARVSLAATSTAISTSHTLFISNLDYATGIKVPHTKPRLYVNGSDRGMVVFSLANPRNPKVLGIYDETYVHDSYAETFKDARTSQCDGHKPCQVLFAWTGGDFRILDVTNARSIQVLSTLTYPNIGYAHSGWISQDKNFLFNFDELDEIRSDAKTRIHTIDISSFKTPQMAGTFRGKQKSIEHNGIVIGNKLYLAHYTRGLVIMDVSNPERIRERAFFDSHPNDDAETNDVHPAAHPGHEGDNRFAGAWGVYPFLPSANILISDMERGLFILKEQ